MNLATDHHVDAKNAMHQFKDGSELASLEHSYIKELSKEVVEIAWS